VKIEFLSLLGKVSQDPGNEFRHKFRIHQGWWRTAVLLEEPGPHPQWNGKFICNTINVSEENKRKNFLALVAFNAAEEVIGARKEKPSGGIVQESRLWGNLLSSQPLCSNFWGPLKYNHSLANAYLSQVIPDFGTLIEIHFEWAPQPKEDYTDDNSAFDVMIEYLDRKQRRAICGLECKYTDSLSTSQIELERRT
jgi:hypothetical protein